MRFAAIICAYLSLIGCGAIPTEKNAAKMDSIEARVELPRKARLSDYARYYADMAGGRTIARYILPLQKPEPDDVCEYIENGSTACPKAPPTIPELAAGQRIWLDDANKLPEIHDGGCSVITVLAYPQADGPITAECNGDA